MNKQEAIKLVKQYDIEISIVDDTTMLYTKRELICDLFKIKESDLKWAYT